MNFENNEIDFEKLWCEEDRILNRETIGEPSKDINLAGHSNFDLLLKLQTYLGELSARSLNDPDAAESLWAFAGIVCHDLWEVCDRKPDVVRNCAARKMFFPINWTLLKGQQKRIFEKIESLGVGTGAIYKLPRNKKQFDPDAPVNKLVLYCVDKICELQSTVFERLAQQHLKADLTGKRIPSVEVFVQDSITRIKEPWLKKVMSLSRLSSANADDWAETIWQNILRTNDGTPEKHPELYEIGKYRERHSEYQDQQKKVTPRTAAANIRAGIKERFFKAVRTLAR
jgi:AcrR family transcriptional regulator